MKSALIEAGQEWLFKERPRASILTNLALPSGAVCDLAAIENGRISGVLCYYNGDIKALLCDVAGATTYLSEVWVLVSQEGLARLRGRLPVHVGAMMLKPGRPEPGIVAPATIHFPKVAALLQMLEAAELENLAGKLKAEPVAAAVETAGRRLHDQMTFAQMICDGICTRSGLLLPTPQQILKHARPWSAYLAPVYSAS